MDEQHTPDSNSPTADRGLSSVAKSGPKVSDMAWAVGALILVLGIIWMNYGGTIGAQDQSSMTTPQDEQYRVVGAVRDPVIPEQELAAPTAQQAQADTIDPMLLQYQLRLEELERKRSEAEQKHAEARKRSPMMVYSKGGSRANAAASSSNDMFAGNNNNALSSLSGSNFSAPEGFVDGNQRSHVETVRAGRLSNQDYMISQGTTIRGILETAIQSDLAGYIRAIVSEDIYSFDGSQVLVPRGSKIIGRYQSGIKQSQSRLFVVWQRIIRPDGIDIMVDSPGTDYLGRAGLGGDVDTHFMERFGSAILLSMIDGVIQAGVNAANDDSAETVVTGSGGGLNRSAELALENSINVRPTIHIDQGTPINIFVTKDMDFSSTASKNKKVSWWQ